MELTRLTRSELNLFNACIDMALAEFDGKKDEVKSTLETSGSYDFFSVMYAEIKLYHIGVKADLTYRDESLRFIKLTASYENIDFASVERKGLGVRVEYLKALFHDLKLHLKRLREQTIFLELCSIVEATQKRSELTDGDDLYFIEYEVRDSHLVLYALKTIGGNTSLMAEFKTKEPFNQGISGLYKAIISHYKSLNDNSDMSSGG